MTYRPIMLLALIAALACGCVTESAIRHEQQLQAAEQIVKGLARSPSLQKRAARLLMDDAVIAVGGFAVNHWSETGLGGAVLAFLGIQAKKVIKKRKAGKA